MLERLFFGSGSWRKMQVKLHLGLFRTPCPHSTVLVVRSRPQCQWQRPDPAKGSVQGCDLSCRQGGPSYRKRTTLFFFFFLQPWSRGSYPGTRTRNDRGPKGPPPILQDRHGHVDGHDRHRTRELAHRSARLEDIERHRTTPWWRDQPEVLNALQPANQRLDSYYFLDRANYTLFTLRT